MELTTLAAGMKLARLAAKKRKSDTESENSKKMQFTTLRAAVMCPFFVSHDTTPTDTVFVSHDCIITQITQAGNIAVDARERV